MIVLDVETSGVDPYKHSILSIGALDFDDPTNQFYDECRAWDGAKLSDEAFQINGFSKESALDTSKKSEAELVREFFLWATDRPQERTLAAQNVSFDQAFVTSAAERAGVAVPFAKRTLDLHTLVWMHMVHEGIAPPKEKHHSALSSTSILEYCGLPKEARPHNALTGALWHAEVLSRVAYNKTLLDEFSSYDIPWLKK